MRELASEDFQPRRAPQPLADDEIHLWFFPQWQTASSGVAESAEVRRLLAVYLDVDAADLQIERCEHGKPRIAGGNRLEFNLSHSGGALLLGLSRTQPLGVDLEVPGKNRPVLGLARRYFDPAETSALKALPGALLQPAFLRLWSCKEAMLKADGRGIGYGLHRIVFDLDTRGEVAGMHADDLGHLPSAWQLVRLAPAASLIGALAWCGPPGTTVRAFMHGQL